MVTLRLLGSRRDPGPNINVAHRMASSEGEAACRLLDEQGYPEKAPINRKERGSACPYHESPGAPAKGKTPNFSLNKSSGLFQCLAGETMVLTENGARPIRELVGSTHRLLTVDPWERRPGGRWVDAPVKSFGVQTLVKIVLTRHGMKKVIRATAGHRWFVHKKGGSKQYEVTTEGLAVGDQFIPVYPPSRAGTSHISPVGVIQGFAFGDGSAGPRQRGVRVDMYGDKIDAILPFVPGFAVRQAQTENGVPLMQIFGLPHHFKDYPNLQDPTAHLLGWLAGYIAADGNVNSNGTAQLHSADRQAIQSVRDVGLVLGIATHPIRTFTTDKKLPQGAVMKDATLYGTTFAFGQLHSEWILRPKQRSRMDAALEGGLRGTHAEWTVVSIEDDVEEEVFCAEVEGTHAFGLEDNILTGNCFSASCGERGNLRSLERLFGIDVEDDWVEAVRTRDQELQLFEMDLTKDRRRPFYEHGLTDQTIERFRIGWDRAKGRYVIPYLHGRRPRFFRYYNPFGEAKWKWTWESGAEAGLFNSGDAVGDSDGLVIVAESEVKSMLLVQLGYAAVGVPGADIWRDEWTSLFTHARRIVVLFDNDSPEHHIYDQPDLGRLCQKCQGAGLPRCVGHNPGQDAALRRVEQLGWRARNVVLPLPPGQRKTDINEYIMRDGATGEDLKELVTGRSASMRVASLAEIMETPPPETAFLVEQGILPASGRLLVAGSPKCGKSLVIENLALSLAAGIPFLGRFGVSKPTRVLLLDRELSRRSLFDRLGALLGARPAYRAGVDQLLIDHDHLIRLDQANARETLTQIIAMNGAEVVILDTAFKFISDLERSSALMAAFATLDHVIAETGVAVVLTHHLRKSQGSGSGQAQDHADPDRVAGSFLWTGWPNATMLLNFMERSVVNPYNVAATFTAFRDAAPPEPLALYRSPDSIAYTKIEDYKPPANGKNKQPSTLNTETIIQMLMDSAPIAEKAFMHAAGAMFGGENKVRPFYLDAMASGGFTKSGYPAMVRFKHDKQEETWDQEHGLQIKIGEPQ